MTGIYYILVYNIYTYYVHDSICTMYHWTVLDSSGLLYRAVMCRHTITVIPLSAKVERLGAANRHAVLTFLTHAAIIKAHVRSNLKIASINFN